MKAVKSLILAASVPLQLAFAEVYLSESFDIVNNGWAFPNQEFRDERTKLFSFDKGNEYEDSGSIGLFTRWPDSKYVASKLLTSRNALDTSKHNFAVEFKVKQEQG